MHGAPRKWGGGALTDTREMDPKNKKNVESCRTNRTVIVIDAPAAPGAEHGATQVAVAAVGGAPRRPEPGKAPDFKHHPAIDKHGRSVNHTTACCGCSHGAAKHARNFENAISGLWWELAVVGSPCVLSHARLLHAPPRPLHICDMLISSAPSS